MSIQDIEQHLIETGRQISVKDSDDVPFADYHEFVNLEKAGKIRISSAYDADLVKAFGGNTVIITHYLLVWSPALLAIASIVFSLLSYRL